MSLKTSALMPVENYSVVQQSENGTQFDPNNKIRFRIGSHLGYIDFHTSYLQFNLQVKNALTKMEFANGMGADILIRTWRVLIGGHIVEEIDHPNVLLKTLKYDYGNDLGLSEKCEVLDKSGKATGYQGLNNVGVINLGNGDSPCADKVKCILDLNFSGVFGSTQTFPVGMTGDVEIEITLEDPRKCLQVIRSAFEPHDITPNAGHPTSGRRIANIPVGAVASVDLIDEVGKDTFMKNKSSTGEAFLNDVPFCIGNCLELKGEGGAGGANVALDNVATGNITNITAGGAGNSIRITAGMTAIATNIAHDMRARLKATATTQAGGTNYDNNGTLTYEVSVPSLFLKVVVPPDQYVAEQARKVATEGFQIDIPTYTCYKANTYAGIPSATLEIPCYASRARSLICIGVDGSQPLGGNNYLTRPYRFDGHYNDLQEYQFQIGENRQPVRPVNCGNLSTFQHNVAQEQLTELEKALRSAGCNVKSLRKHRTNFVIGRALSSYGGSIPLTMKGARVYLDYLSQDKRNNADVVVGSKQWFNYCSHIRRLNITPQGVSVMY